MKIKPPFTIERPKSMKGFGRLARVQIWYVNSYQQRFGYMCTQILSWHSFLYSGPDYTSSIGYPRYVQGKPAGWIS